MIPHKQESVTQTGDTQFVAKFNIAKESLSHILGILRSQIYSDKIKAVIRELSANALDAMVEIGKVDKPFEITLPDYFSSTFIVRDFGKGLSEEGIKTIVANLGTSTKRESNNLVGMFGIGLNSVFAYGDQAILTSYQNGKKTVYNMFIGDDKIGEVCKMAEEETEESDGLEIQVPISKGDYHSFCEKAKEVLRFHKVKPVIKGAEINFENEASFDGGTDWRFTGEGESIAISGCVGYPIDANSIKGITEGQKAILEAGIEIEFNLGEITPTASREGLSYDKKTQSVILAKLERVSQELGQKLNDLFKDCKNIWEAKEIYKKNFEDSHFGYTLKQFCGEIKWKNEVISNSYFDFSDIKDCEVFKYRRYRGRRGVERIKKTKDVSISVDDKIYFNDLEKRGGLKRRIDTIFEDKNISSITVIKADSVAFAEIKKLENLDIESFIGNKIIRLSTIPKKVYLSGSRDVSDLAYVRTYELDISKVKQDYWHKPVGFWISAEIDFDEDDGIYLEVKRFVPLSISFRELSGKLSLLSRIGVKIDKIYGLKPSVVKKAKNNAWQSFDEFFEEAISEYIENNNLQMAYLASNKLGEFGDWVKLFKESEVTGFYKKFIHTYNELSKLGNNDKLNSIRNYLSVANFTEKLDSKFDISEKTLFSHYSLLEDIPFYRVENSQEGKGRILEYIKMVDSLAETAAPSEKNP